MSRHPVRLPNQWSRHVKSGILHAVALASVAVSYARGRATGERRLSAELDRATNEIALLREELGIKDDRRSRPGAPVSRKGLRFRAVESFFGFPDVWLPTNTRNPKTQHVAAP